MYFLTGLTAGNAAGYRSSAINTGTEDILLLPAVLLGVSCSLVLSIFKAAYLVWTAIHRCILHGRTVRHLKERFVAFCRFLPGRSMLLDFGSLHQKPRVGGTHGRVRRHGLDGWRSPVPGRRYWGRGRVHPPPTIRCQSRRQVQNILTLLFVDSVRDGRLSTSRWVHFPVCSLRNAAFLWPAVK